MYEFACRVCLKNPGTLPIFGDERKPDISMEISSFGDIHIRENDSFPKFICEECFKLLESAISFRKSAKRSDTLLKRWKRKKEVPPTNIQSEPPQNETQVPSSSNFDPEQLNIDFVSVGETECGRSYISCIKDEMTIFNPTHMEIDVQIEDEIEVANDDMNEEPLISKEIKEEHLNCKYCNLNFLSSKDYEEHRTTIEHKRNYIVSFLPKKKKSYPTTKAKTTVNPKDHKCEICNRFFTKFHYPRHMHAEHKIKLEGSRSKTKKECTICKKMLHPAALYNHMKKIHGNEKDMKPKVKLVCPICKKLFSQHFYPLHMQRHEQGDSKSYVCDQCGKKFFFKSSFWTHRLIHTNELPHKCEYCPYRGRTKELLKIHVRTHTGDYPYKCTQCDIRCLTKSNLNSHMMRRHRGPIDFICDVCSRGFYSKIQLERHISVIHYGIKNHLCSICGAAFGYRHGLMNHQRKVHKRPKGIGKPKAVYQKLEEEGLLPPLKHTQEILESLEKV